MGLQQLLNLLPMLLALGLTTVLADVSHLRNNLEYTIRPSSQVAYYHYPPPGRPLLDSKSAYYSAPRPRQPVAPRQQYQTAGTQHQAVARQFAAPALEHAAFTQALSSQGYTYGGASVAQSSGRAINSLSAADANSLNVKLPVPFGITPLNIAQLPLQAGAPYATLPRTTGLTSYGTPELQRR